MTRLLLFVATITILVVSARSQVKVGIDNLIDTDMAILRGKRLTLVTHAAARTLDGRSTAEVMIAHPDVRVIRLLTPEHGYYGVVPAGDHVDNDTIGGIPAVSLYGRLRRPTPDMLSDVDAVVVDLQDIGVRSYTYLSTMVEVMEACAAIAKPIYILDRPNPWGGHIVDGNIVDDSLTSFIGRLPIPYLHGCTLGELATMANGEGWLGRGGDGTPRRCSLTVVRCKRWLRSMPWEATERPWYPTSPNIPTMNAVRGYALTGLAGELGLMSIGIGTTMPFCMLGAPGWPGDSAMIASLRRCGIRMAPARFLPATGKYARTVCSGYVLQDVAARARPYAGAMAILAALVPTTDRPPASGDSADAARRTAMFVKACGSAEMLEALRSGNRQRLDVLSRKGLEAYTIRRKRYLLYTDGDETPHAKP